MTIQEWLQANNYGNVKDENNIGTEAVVNEPIAVSNLVYAGSGKAVVDFGFATEANRFRPMLFVDQYGNHSLIMAY